MRRCFTCGPRTHPLPSQDDNSFRPVAYASRSLSEVERQYSQIGREALAVKFGCLSFDHYLSGDPSFTIITNQKPLLALYRPGSRPPPLIERWELRIQHVKFQLRYEPGPKNPTDVFSRQPLPPQINPSERKDTRVINAIITSSLPKACTLKEKLYKQSKHHSRPVFWKNTATHSSTIDMS